MSFAGALTFLAFPAAPPWLASKHELIPHVARIGYIEGGSSPVETSKSWIESQILSNPVAAVPSLHAAYALLVLLFAYAWRGRIAAWIAAPYTLGMWFTIVYLGRPLRRRHHRRRGLRAGRLVPHPEALPAHAAAPPDRAVPVAARARRHPEQRCSTLGPMSDDVRELIIIGGACAGLTAAVYASRANLHPLCIEGFEAGGQLMITSDVENFPGFPEGVLGPDLMVRFREQAERFGTEFITDDVTSVDFSEQPFKVNVGAKEYRARAVIVATGASARQLGLDSEQALQARGVSYCATCDAAFFPDKKVIVVGGGDSALEEATYLTKFASDVVLVHRRDELRGSKIMQDYAKAKPNLSLLTPYVVEEVLGADVGRVTGARLRNPNTGEEHIEESDGFFVAIGHTPNTELFRGILEMDENGYLTVEPGTTRTKIPGIFAAGDVADHVYRQAITAAGSGCMAALDAERWLTHGDAAS